METDRGLIGIFTEDGVDRLALDVCGSGTAGSDNKEWRFLCAVPLCNAVHCVARVKFHVDSAVPVPDLNHGRV